MLKVITYTLIVAASLLQKSTFGVIHEHKEIFIIIQI